MRKRGLVSATYAFRKSVGCVLQYDAKIAEEIRQAEDETDHLEDILGTYLVKLTARHIGEEESVRATEYMKLIGDYERIADHAVNIVESAEEMEQKKIAFSEQAAGEYQNLCAAVSEIVGMSYQAFSKNDFTAARKTEPLEQVIDDLKEELRTRHIIRLQKGECTVDAGFVWSDLLTTLSVFPTTAPTFRDVCSTPSGTP